MARAHRSESGGEKDGKETDSLQFASLIAHQLQSPLSAVSSLLQNVLAEYAGPLSPRQRGPLEKAEARCSEAITAVRRMLAIIRAREAGVETASVSLDATIRRLHGQYSAEAAGRGMSLVMATGAAGLLVKLAEPALIETLRALLNNAMKYTPDHGRIRMATRRSSAEGFATLCVADSGIGIPEDERERVFDPFYRSAVARRSEKTGVGLGLAFVKGIVTAAGGSIAVRTSEYGGTEFVMELPLAPEAETSDFEKQPPSMRVVIVGGVTAGPKAAAKIARLRPDAEITVVDKGSVTAYAGCGLPYYVSGVVKEQSKLLCSPAGVTRDPVFSWTVKNVHVRNRTVALEIDRPNRKVRVRDAGAGDEIWLPYDKLLLATGSSPVIPKTLANMPENVFTLHGVADAEGIKTALAQNRARDVVIVGGGLIGIEMTEALSTKGARITIVEKEPRILPMVDAEISCLVEKHLEANGVKVVTRARAESFQGSPSVTAVVTDKGVYPADMVILGTGVRPNAELARSAGLEIGATGAIHVDQYLRTSDPDIYAAGDCAETTHLLTGRPFHMPLGSTAMKQGRVAAVNICGGSDVFKGVLGSCICKVFNFCVARTGLGETEAREVGYDVVTALAAGQDRAHYMPNVGLLLLKLVVDRRTRKLLGVQSTGAAAGDKRVDVAAMAITSGWTVDELSTADLCYAPPYSTAMDNLITAANVARNKMDGWLETVSSAEVRGMLANRVDFILLDVRAPEEFERVHLPHSVMIPLGSLRGRVNELPRDKPIVALSSIALRAYEASLILKTAGFRDVRVMEGGLAMWPFEMVE